MVRNEVAMSQDVVNFAVPTGLNWNLQSPGAAVTVAFVFPIFWVPGVGLGLTGAYLLVWAVVGKGRWCRNCKNFGIGH